MGYNEGFSFDKGNYKGKGQHSWGQGARGVASKKSGCKKWDKNGKRGLSAWNSSKGKGFVSVFVNVISDDEFDSKTGRTYVKVCSTIFYKNTGNEFKEWGLMDLATSKVIIKKLGWVLNPNAKNGGYCGTYNKK